jgi:transposase
MSTHTHPWRSATGGDDRRPLDPDHAADLRRRKGRELADYLLACAQVATTDDRELLKAVYAEGMTAAQVARLSGAAPRTVRRRVRRVVQRCLDPRFAFVMRERDRWPSTRRRVATACVLQGRTLRGAARHLRTSLHCVRKEMNVIDALFQSQEHMRHSASGRDSGALQHTHHAPDAHPFKAGRPTQRWARAATTTRRP